MGQSGFFDFHVRYQELSENRAPFVRVPSTRRIARWLGAEPKRLLEEGRCFVEALCDAAPKLKQASEQIRAVADFLLQVDPAELGLWSKEAAATDLRGFASGLRQDEAAVRAAIIEPWSDGPVEGQIARLKLIKCSIKAAPASIFRGFDLPRQRPPRRLSQAEAVPFTSASNVRKKLFRRLFTVLQIARPTFSTTQTDTTPSPDLLSAKCDKPVEHSLAHWKSVQ